MSHHDLLSSGQWKLLSAALISGLLLSCQQKAVSAKALPDKLVAQEKEEERVAFSLQRQNPHQKLPSRLLPKQTISQVPNAPIPIPPREIELLVENPKQEPETERETSPKTEQSETHSSSETPNNFRKITVSKFEFEGNTAFSDEELAQTVAKFTNRPISFAELLLAEEEIRKKYTAGCQKQTQQENTKQKKDSQEKCFLNSGAFIIASEQFIAKDNVVVKVKVIEGSIERVDIIGLKKINESYVRSRLQRGISSPLERERLLKALQILQLNPLIENLSAKLNASSRPDKSILEINIIEADSFDLELFTNNGRTPSVGTWRRGIRVNEDNLLGIGDRVFSEYTNTDGSNKLDLGYTAPLNARNTTINLRGQINFTEVTEEPFDRLDIEGNSFNIEFGVRQPVLRTPTQELAVGLSGTRQESITKLLGQNFMLSSGADDNGSTRISALRFYQEYTKRTLQDVFAVRSQFSVGLDVFDATVNEDPLPDSRFFAWRGQGQYVRRLARDSLLVLRSDLQLAATNLVPLEQFSIGGLDSVRGYRQDSIFTDNGFFASAEVRLPILRVEEVAGILQIAPFFDLGVGWNSDEDPDPEDQTFIGLGLGLRWQMGDDFTARLEYGIPLIDVEDSDETLQENGVYFSINYSPF